MASLLCNQQKDGEYGDAVLDDRIEYVMPNDTLKGERRVLEEMVGTTDAFYVFEKLGVNAWKSHGRWVVARMTPRIDVTVFELRRADDDRASRMEARSPSPAGPA